MKPPRESRSLSSKNTNFNLGLDGGQRQRADNQRKLQPRESKHRRLLIIDSSSRSSSNLPDQPTSGRRGRVEMTGYERRRHRNNHGKHLTRSMTTGANDSFPADKTPAQSPAADSILAQSRLANLANANEPANDINRQSSTRVRHQHARRIEHAPNPDNGLRKRQHKQQQQHQHQHQDRMNTEAQSANTTVSGSGSGATNHRRISQLQHGSETAASSDLANTHDLAHLGGIYAPLPPVSTHVCAATDHCLLLGAQSASSDASISNQPSTLNSSIRIRFAAPTDAPTTPSASCASAPAAPTTPNWRSPIGATARVSAPIPFTIEHISHIQCTARKSYLPTKKSCRRIRNYIFLAEHFRDLLYIYLFSEFLCFLDFFECRWTGLLACQNAAAPQLD